jgi:hypothetical protein
MGAAEKQWDLLVAFSERTEGSVHISFRTSRLVRMLLVPTIIDHIHGRRMYNTRVLGKERHLRGRQAANMSSHDDEYNTTLFKTQCFCRGLLCDADSPFPLFHMPSIQP